MNWPNVLLAAFGIVVGLLWMRRGIMGILTETMTTQEIRIVELVSACSCAELQFLVGRDGERLYLQIGDGLWSGRKWMLSPHMTDAEVVQTAMAAVLAWHEHEAREAFKFRGAAIFNPHLSLKALLERAQSVEVRG